MSLSRRQFVYVASLSVLATSASPSLFAQDEAEEAREIFTEEGSAALGNFSLRDFEWLIGERFSISLPGQKLGKLTLVEATVLDPIKPSSMTRTVGQVAKQAPSVALTGFWLRFQGAGGTLPQDSYIMQQGGLGTFPLFIVPAGLGESNHPTYLALFTRFAGPAPNMSPAPSE
ncbi:MAG: hypothetical protein ABSF28_01905 [Terracidiphilus sp.]|jgi:hypothetical protein